MGLQWIVNFFQVERTTSIKQTNQPNLDGLLTLNCSNVIPDGKIMRNGCIWFWGYVHFEVWLRPDAGICLWQPPRSWQLCPSTQNSAAAQGNQL